MQPLINTKNQSDFRRTGIAFGIIFLLGILVSILPCRSTQSAGTAIIWVLACLSTGAGLGFLFGIPKILQSNTPAANGDNGGSADNIQGSNYQQQVNTNLTEISDWLTKIIVGLSLINLGKFPPVLEGMAKVLAAGMYADEPTQMMAFAYGIIVCFFVLGFLFGYLTTRLFLAGAFSRADQQALQQFEDSLRSTNMQLASLETNQGFIRDSVFSQEEQDDEPTDQKGVKSRGGKEVEKDQSSAIEQLEKMANAYLEMPISMQGDMLSRKDKLTNEMAFFILKKHLSKEEVVKHYQTNNNEGLVSALATLVNMRPEESDFAYLVQTGQNVTRPHVKYRVLMGLGKLASMHCMKPGDRKKAIQMASSYRSGNNAILNNTIDATIALMKTTSTSEVSTR